MPDPILLIQAAFVAGVISGLILLLFAWPWKFTRSACLGIGWTLGVGLGFFAGCWVLGFWPNWPPTIDRDRLLLVLLPITILVEFVASLALFPSWLKWILRFGLAVGITPILLHGTIYLADIAGPGTREWPLPQAIFIVVGLACLLIITWILLEWLQSRSSGKTTGTALFLTSAASGVTIMLSGYSSGGQMGIPLSGAFAGAIFVSFFLHTPVHKVRFSGVGLVTLFSLLLLGRFFGTLPSFSAICLLLAPLGALIPEITGLRNLNLKLRTVLRVILVAIPLFFVVSAAEKKFSAEATSSEEE